MSVMKAVLGRAGVFPPAMREIARISCGAILHVAKNQEKIV